MKLAYNVFLFGDEPLNRDRWKPSRGALAWNQTWPLPPSKLLDTLSHKAEQSGQQSPAGDSGAQYHASKKPA